MGITGTIGLSQQLSREMELENYTQLANNWIGVMQIVKKLLSTREKGSSSVSQLAHNDSGHMPLFPYTFNKKGIKSLTRGVN